MKLKTAEQKRLLEPYRQRLYQRSQVIATDKHVAMSAMAGQSVHKNMVVDDGIDAQIEREQREMDRLGAACPHLAAAADEAEIIKQKRLLQAQHSQPAKYVKQPAAVMRRDQQFRHHMGILASYSIR